MRKNKKVRYIITIGILAICCVVWSVMFIQINKKYPDTVLVTYEKNEAVQFSECTIKLMGYKWITHEDITSLGCMEDYESYDLGDMKAISLSVLLENKSQKECSVDLTSMVLELPGYVNQMDFDLFVELNQEMKKLTLHPTLQPGEKVEVQLPFVIYEDSYFTTSWNEIEKQKGGLVISSYPIKQVLRFN